MVGEESDGDGPDDRTARVVDLFEDRVREELRIANESGDLGLSDNQIENLMFGVTSGVLYAFSLDWDPDWVKEGDFHHWQEADGYRARCPHCLIDSPASPTAQTAVFWVRQHLESSHPGRRARLDP